jgi:iron complex outermembrane recepter protein
MPCLNTVRKSTLTAMALFSPIYLLCPSVALAQAANQSPRPEVETILVTATKRTSQLEQVPAALSVLSGAELQLRGVTNFEGLVDQVPGVSINYAFGGASAGLLAIRGVGGADDYKPNGAPSVALHVDGIYQSSNAYLTTPFFDVERVEVLKGPQGTLYGRNTTAGVINLLTKSPKAEFEAFGDARLGSFEHRVIEGAISGTVFGALRGRLALFAEQGGGFMDGEGAGLVAGFQPTVGRVRQTQVPAVTDPGPRDGFGDKDILAARGTFVYDFSDSASLNVKIAASTDQSEIQPYDRINLASDTTVFNAGENDDPYSFYSNAYYGRDIDTQSASATFDQAFGDGLKLSVIAGYQQTSRNYAGNGDGTPYPQFQYQFIEDLSQSSFEARLANTPGGKFDWVVGAFAMQDEADFDSIWTSFSALTVYRSDHKQERTSAAIFGQGDWRVSDKLTLGLGLRATADKATYVGINNDLNPWKISTFSTVFATTSPFSWDREFEDSKVTGKLTAQYQVNDNARVYASYGTGYRAGGFDGTSIFTLEETFPFDSETVAAAEAGMRWTGKRLRISIDLFSNEFRELQSTTRLANDTNGRTNVGRAKTSGVDISVRGRLVQTDRQTLDVTGSLAGLHSEITEFTSRRIADVVATLGDPLPAAPELMTSFSLTHNVQINDSMRLTTALTTSYHGAESNRLNAVPGNTSRGYNLTNARVDLAIGDNFSVYAYGRNLADTVYFPELNGPVRMVGAPKTLGVGIRFSR